MLRANRSPIVKKASLLVGKKGKDLYLVRATFGDTALHCVSFALSEDYRVSGKLVSNAEDVSEIAQSVDKIIILYRERYLDATRVNDNGVGYIYLFEDLDGRVSLVCWKNEMGVNVTISDAYANLEAEPRWK